MLVTTLRVAVGRARNCEGGYTYQVTHQRIHQYQVSHGQRRRKKNCCLRGQIPLEHDHFQLPWELLPHNENCYRM